MKTYLMALSLLAAFPALAADPDCHSWPMNMAEAWLKNENIVDIPQLDQSKTEIKRLASEKKENALFTQVHYFVFHDKTGNRYAVITQSDASTDECSMSEVNTFLIEKSDINH